MWEKIKEKFKNKKVGILLCIFILVTVMILLIAIFLSHNSGNVINTENNAIVNVDDIKELAKDISVSDSEVEEYKTLYSQFSSEMRGILIMFETEEECREFIYNYGSEENPEELGIGIIPILQEKEGYKYHIVNNKAKVREEFLNLNDGEFTSEPFVYLGKYCYLKRIAYVSIDDDKIKEQIKMQKAELEYRGYKKVSDEDA